MLTTGEQLPYLVQILVSNSPVSNSPVSNCPTSSRITLIGSKQITVKQCFAGSIYPMNVRTIHVH